VADVTGIILNRTNISMRSGHGKMCMQMLEKNYDGLILQNFLLQNIDLTNACAKGEFLEDYNAQSKAVKNVELLTNEILERL
jgi:cellulose biosynthesis protein BcsQ